MSVVIIGGNERMEREYKNMCRDYGCRAKVFCKCRGSLESRIGSPDLLILFTHTVSHKMVKCALDVARPDTMVVRSHTSSLASLRQILTENTGDSMQKAV